METIKAPTQLTPINRARLAVIDRLELLAGSAADEHDRHKKAMKEMPSNSVAHRYERSMARHCTRLQRAYNDMMARFFVKGLQGFDAAYIQALGDTNTTAETYRHNQGAEAMLPQELKAADELRALRAWVHREMDNAKQEEQEEKGM